MRDALLSPVELAQNLGLSLATLASWRSRKKGPAYMKLGREIFYPRDRVERWMRSQLRETCEEPNDGTEESRRAVALPVQAGRQRVLRNHRLGRHQTKSERGAADRERTPQGASGGAAPVTPSGGPSVQ
ncbi:MAG: helix-turn-helix domain-containing protein [Acidobacteriia bacterium]|nr:helix-turn-helix domain-containing protein [Terriglobia bacterium]